MRASLKNESLLSHEELLRIFDYNKDTGLFTYKVSTARCIHVGDVCDSRSYGYIRIKIKGKQYAAHRLAWFYVNGAWPIDQIDHKDTIRHHNWIDNLREVNNTHNTQNKRTSLKNNSIKNTIPGVTFDKSVNKYRVSLRIYGKLTHFGYYSTLEEAETVCIKQRRNHFKGNLI